MNHWTGHIPGRLPDISDPWTPQKTDSTIPSQQSPTYSAEISFVTGRNSTPLHPSKTALDKANARMAVWEQEIRDNPTSLDKNPDVSADDAVEQPERPANYSGTKSVDLELAVKSSTALVPESLQNSPVADNSLPVAQANTSDINKRNDSVSQARATQIGLSKAAQSHRFKTPFKSGTSANGAIHARQLPANRAGKIAAIRSETIGKAQTVNEVPMSKGMILLKLSAVS